MRRAVVLAALVGAFLVGEAADAVAHPLGNFTVNRSARIVVGPERLTIRYVLDLAEVPALQELQRIDAEGDGADRAELRAWAGRTAERIARALVVHVDARRITVRPTTASAATVPGEAGLSTLRLEASFAAELAERSGTLAVEDRNDPGRLGWREITAIGVDGVVVRASTVPAVSPTDGLRSYPAELPSGPSAVTAMSARFRPGSSEPPATRGAPSPEAGPAAVDGSFADVLERDGIALMALGALVALALGAWHALLPGHGKMLIAAAIAGSEARTRQAIGAGASVAAMHTVSVIALGVLVLVLERSFRPDAVYPWLRVASGLAAGAVGLHLVVRRWSARRDAHRHTHPHRHGHEHGRSRHADAVPTEGLLSRRGVAALAFAGGILPSPSALIVLLAAIQRGRTAYGLGLVLAFSIGLALSLAVVGLGVVGARNVADRRGWARFGSVVPLVSAAAVVVVGVLVTAGGIASL